MKQINIIMSALMLSLLFSCTSNKGVESQVLLGHITKITAPTNAISDTDVKIKIDFWGPDGCSTAYNIKADKVGQTITIRAYYKHAEEGACTLALVPLSLDYSFFGGLPGTYFFVNASDHSIADTIRIY